jgi:hypothetical protein
MILFVIVDFGVILSSKSGLENDSSDIVELIRSGKDIDDISSMYDDISIDIKEIDDGKYYQIYISKSVNLVTPGLNRILDDPYLISIKRVVVNEED